MSKLIRKYEKFCYDIDKTANCRNIGEMHYVTGICAEAGEVSALYQKSLRDFKTLPVEVDSVELEKELGDILWYLTRLANHKGFSLDRLMESNMRKLAKRYGK